MNLRPSGYESCRTNHERLRSFAYSFDISASWSPLPRARRPQDCAETGSTLSPLASTMLPRGRWVMVTVAPSISAACPAVRWSAFPASAAAPHPVRMDDRVDFDLGNSHRPPQALDGLLHGRDVSLPRRVPCHVTGRGNHAARLAPRANSLRQPEN